MSIIDQITPLLICYNEEPNIKRTLDRLSWAKQIVVIDSFSDDRTIEILESYPQVKYYQRKWDSMAKQWNFGISKVETDWVLSLDSDYYLTDELIAEIKSLEPQFDAYYIKFKYCVFGKPLRGTILPPRCALFRKDKADYIDDGHTQLLRTDRPTGTLAGYIYHDDRKPLSRWLKNQDTYIKLEAEKLLSTETHDLGRADRIRKLKIVAPPLVFFYCLVLKGGIFDGWRGIYYAYQRALAELLLSIRLIEIERENKQSN